MSSKKSGSYKAIAIDTETASTIRKPSVVQVARTALETAAEELRNAVAKNQVHPAR